MHAFVGIETYMQLLSVHGTQADALYFANFPTYGKIIARWRTVHYKHFRNSKGSDIMFHLNMNHSHVYIVLFLYNALLIFLFRFSV